ncbi:C4BPA protein, partial [Campylorhamphus procurvoides]|nr:C4BPA protein [Campylorhamphus procurvoides]
ALRWLFPLLLALPGACGDCPKPPRLVFAELIGIPQNSYPVGAQLRYQCRPGYVRNGDEPPVLTCLSNSTWSKQPDFCIGRSCGQPIITNGNFHAETNLLLGATITFTCHLGYQLVGPPSTQCIFKNGVAQWENIPSCEIILCLPPPEIKNGQLIGESKEFLFGMAASFTCDKGFTLIGESTIYCTMGPNHNGTWSNPAPECKEVRCENPDVKNARRLSGFGTEHTYKDTVTFECNSGYRMKGSNLVTCEANNSWTPPLPKCDEILCGAPPHFPFANLPTPVGASSKFGTKLTYKCNPGYEAAPGKSSVLTCQENDTWSAAEPDFCVRQRCSPPDVKHGNVTGNNQTFPFETVVTFTCDPGHVAIKPTAKCVASGNGVQWDPAPPYCSIRPCPMPPGITNGNHNGQGKAEFTMGMSVTYTCNPGYYLVGNAAVFCRASGNWSQPSPRCEG